MSAETELALVNLATGSWVIDGHMAEERGDSLFVYPRPKLVIGQPPTPPAGFAWLPVFDVDTQPFDEKLYVREIPQFVVAADKVLKVNPLRLRTSDD